MCTSALKIQPSTHESNRKETELLENGFAPIAVTVYWYGTSSFGLQDNIPCVEYAVMLQKREVTLYWAVQTHFKNTRPNADTIRQVVDLFIQPTVTLWLDMQKSKF